MALNKERLQLGERGAWEGREKVEGGGELMEKYSKAPSEVRISSEGLLAVGDNLHVLLM